jgi:hypothetical protein
MAKRKSRSDQKLKRGAPSRVRDGELIEFQRVRLFEALGIVELSRHALASKLVTLDEESVIDALRAAYRIINDVAEGLERAMSRSPTSDSSIADLGGPARPADA